MTIKIPITHILMADGKTTFRQHVANCNQVSWNTALHRYCNKGWSAQEAAEAPKGSRLVKEAKIHETLILRESTQC